MCHIVKIQSISDIITNSSSEVFPIVSYKWGAEDDIERLINAILSAGGSEYTCDDLFDVTNDCGTITIRPMVESSDAKYAATLLSNLENLFEVCDE
jgi:hypothetical protein